MKKNKSIIIFLIIAACLLLLFKIARLHTLAYTIDDFSNNLESTYSWMAGRPLTYANGLGITNYTHNYFLMPFLGPITYWLGPIGIFLFQLLLTVTCWFYYFKTYTFNTAASKIFFISLFFSPTFLWIFDDPGVGWTVELLYLPFSILFALSLKRGLFKWAMLWAFLMATVREDGILMCGFIHISSIIFSNEGKISFLNILTNKKIWLWAAIYISIFGLSMIYLHMHAPKDTFFESAMTSLVQNYENADFQRKNLLLFLKALLMLSPFFLLLFLLTEWNREKFLIFLFVNILLLFVNFIQGARYFDKYFFETVSITWVPRFILPFSFSLAYIILVVGPQELMRLELKKGLKFFLIFLVLIQFPILSFCRQDVNYRSIAKSIFTGKPDVNMAFLVDENDLKMIRNIESIIPKRSNVYALDYIIPIFLNHFIVWSDRNLNYENADIAIIPIDEGFLHMRNELKNVMKPNYSKIFTFGAYELYATDDYRKILTKEKLIGQRPKK